MIRKPSLAALIVICASFTTHGRRTFAADAEGLAATAAQQRRSVAVNVEPPMSVDIVLYAAGMSGRVLATTERNGKGGFDGGVLQNLGTLEVIEETCGERRRVLLVASSNQAPQDRNCGRRPIGTFAGGTETALSIKLPNSEFVRLALPPTIPDPPAEPAPAAVAAAAASTSQAQAPRSQPAASGSQTCPPGAAMVGPKLDLPAGGSELETAALLVPCVYRGLSDTADDRWSYYKIAVQQAQTLKVVFRLRDSNFPQRSKFANFYGVWVRFHGRNGGRVAEESVDEPSVAKELQYKAEESGFAYISLHNAVRDAAFQFSISPTTP